MLTALAIFNGSSINRYGVQFPVETLESGLNQSWEIGTPSFLSHDFHRPVGWSRGLSLYIEPGLTRLTGLSFIPENQKDSDDINRGVRYSLNKRIAEMFEPHRSDLEKRLSPYISSDTIGYTPDCVAIADKKLATKVFPDIFVQQDKDGLISLSQLNPIAPGIFEKDGLLLFAHPYFRRSLSRLNTLAVEFLALLQKLAKEPSLDVKIALDPEMIGLAETFVPHIELAYWWGPKFSDCLSEIPIGTPTRYIASEEQKLFHGISQTEFWWYIQEDRRTFECEELRDIPSFGVDSDHFGCRYVHCRLDRSGSHSVHLDGAIRMYDLEAMVNRLDTDMMRAGRHTQYTKLWKIDKDLDVQIWKELITHYYRDNHLVGEYLGGKDEAEIIRPTIVTSQVPDKVFLEYIPYNMTAGQGIKISVSYHSKTENLENSRFIRPFDNLTIGVDKFDYIEADTIEIIKLLRRSGNKIECSDEIQFIIFIDMVLNLPLIMHTGLNAVQLAQQTQNAIKMLCDVWGKQNDDRLLSYNIGVQYANKDVYFSIAGHIHDVNIWLHNAGSGFPAEEGQIGKWCADAERFLSDQFPESNDSPPFQNLLKRSGMLLFERRILNSDEYVVRYDDEKEALMTDLVIPKNSHALYDKIINNQLQVACAFLLKESDCSKCGKTYQLCNCSKYLDENVIERMVDISFVYPFWTNRRAFG